MKITRDKYNFLFSDKIKWKNEKYFVNKEKIIELKEKISEYHVVTKLEEGRFDMIVRRKYGSVEPYKSILILVFCIDEFRIKEGDVIPLIEAYDIDNALKTI